jgi:hypothetical protein
LASQSSTCYKNCFHLQWHKPKPKVVISQPSVSGTPLQCMVCVSVEYGVWCVRVVCVCGVCGMISYFASGICGSQSLYSRCVSNNNSLVIIVAYNSLLKFANEKEASTRKCYVCFPGWGYSLRRNMFHSVDDPEMSTRSQKLDTVSFSICIAFRKFRAAVILGLLGKF